MVVDGETRAETRNKPERKSTSFLFSPLSSGNVSPYLHVITPLKEHAGSVPLEKHRTKLGERGRTSVM